MAHRIHADPELAAKLAHLDEDLRPCEVLPGFDDVALAADEAMYPIIRHVRSEAHHHSTERTHGTAMTTLRGSPRARSQGRLRGATP